MDEQSTEQRGVVLVADVTGASRGAMFFLMVKELCGMAKAW